MGLRERHGDLSLRLYPDAGLPGRLRRPLHRRWQEIDDRIEEWNNPDILDSGTAVQWDNRAGLDAKAKSIEQVLLRQFPHSEILFQ